MIKKNPYILTIIGSFMYILMSITNRFFVKIPEKDYVILGGIFVLMVIIGLIMDKKKKR